MKALHNNAYRIGLSLSTYPKRHRAKKEYGNREDK
jgi:hypothetical protein